MLQPHRTPNSSPLPPQPIRNMSRRMQRQQILQLKHTVALITLKQRHPAPRMRRRHNVLIERVLAREDLVAKGARVLVDVCDVLLEQELLVELCIACAAAESRCPLPLRVCSRHVLLDLVQGAKLDVAFPTRKTFEQLIRDLSTTPRNRRAMAS